ncbi:hypothetical protein [Pseudoalteromonas luteoviolacea]|uniref:MORN repeat protein n=1 Tax=Pseudoalteromonas luteoviolacea (strain 2ta16) TaxID=1353533 RepID=V4HAX3_PSEL2|nr:hypothetical protein [Pseudoalteromonas luteoviolacea]ESP94631.1 hypothetical protein PL2TA16_00631 [Pseudoalteromonas luteoviolacea 2ta16]KZN32330.1 hypothetical protein N483_04035 [Pseudoalteromonas luteoviolacea NCIMB 1944]
MKFVLPLLFFFFMPLVSAKPLTPGYFLKWDSDHTEREIRPVYPIDEKEIANFKVYKVAVENAKPSSVCFYAFSKPSDKSSFGAHCMRFTYSGSGITRSFFNVAGEQVVNHEGVHTVKYLFQGNKYPLLRRHLDVKGQLKESSLGVAEYRFKRDSKGRRISEIRFDGAGNVVPEHNGFYEARFAFDNNDYATYRKGFDKNGHIMEGPNGYATAYFWFDENGTFLKEEFRDTKENLVLGPSGFFAKIVYGGIDDSGNWHKISLYDEKDQLVSNYAAYAIAKYDRLNQRESITYYDAQMKVAQNNRGVAKYLYKYDSEHNLIKREGYSAINELVTQ